MRRNVEKRLRKKRQLRINWPENSLSLKYRAMEQRSDGMWSTEADKDEAM